MIISDIESIGKIDWQKYLIIAVSAIAISLLVVYFLFKAIWAIIFGLIGVVWTIATSNIGLAIIATAIVVALVWHQYKAYLDKRGY